MAPPEHALRDFESGAGGGAGRGDDAARRARYAALGDRALVALLRARDGDAVEEFIRRFEPVAAIQARRLRVPPAERRHWVAELLYDVATTVAAGEGQLPHSIPGYLVTACRWKAMAAERDRALREEREGDAMREVAGAGEWAVSSACSEDSLRAAEGPGWEPLGLSPVLEKLVGALEGGVTGEERQLLSWVGQRVPYSLMAEWLGVGRSAAVKRVTRLRARLLEVAVRLGAALDDEERAELLRFLRRAGVGDHPALRELEGHGRAASDSSNGQYAGDESHDET